MIPRPLVLNEWILHDIAGDNGTENQESASRVLVTLLHGETKLVVMRGSRWVAKVYQIWSTTDPVVRSLIRQLYLEILIDSRRGLLRAPDCCSSVPSAWIEGVPEDDAYLVSTYYFGHADILVTHDEKLMSILQSQGHVNVVSRREFMNSIPR